MSHNYFNWEGNGKTAINPSPRINTGFNPNAQTLGLNASRFNPNQ